MREEGGRGVTFSDSLDIPNEKILVQIDKFRGEDGIRIVENPFHSEFEQKFEPIRLLGQGGFGCVFEALNKMDQHRYAVKRIPLAGSEQAVSKALKEVQALAPLRHEGIVGYNSSWMERPPVGWQKEADEKLLKNIRHNTPFVYRHDCVFVYIQMELCKHTLTELLSNEFRDFTANKPMFKQVVAGVGYLHKKGKIHRDLKPSNILIDDDGRLKICDLGIVADQAIENGREVDSTKTWGVGTNLYKAPEQHGCNYSSKVDIFSLGLILTEMYTNFTSFELREVFDDLRRGVTNRMLDDIPEVATFVSWLTNVNSAQRPDCTEILNHEFLS